MKLTERLVMTTIDWAYEKAIKGVPGLDSAEELAEKYTKKKGTLDSQVNSLIRYQNSKAGISGFVSGLGGAIVLPLTLPANFTSVIYMQIRMIAAIAHMGGYQLTDPKVKTFILLCLAGKPAEKMLREMGISFGAKITKEIVKSITVNTATSMNNSIITKLLAKFGGRSTLVISKAVPLVGGVIGGAFDCITTNTIGNIARDMFIGENGHLTLEEVTVEPTEDKKKTEIA